MKIGKSRYEAMARIIPLMFIFALILSVVSVSAITGSIQNARMIVRTNTGETIEKYVLIKNVNEQEIKIDLKTSGELAEYIKLKETEFNLAPGEDKKAYFTIKAPKNGTTESRIEVTFANADGKGNGIGLTSTIIVIADETKNTNLFANLDNKTAIIIATIVIVLILLIFLVFIYKKRNKFKKSAEIN